MAAGDHIKVKRAGGLYTHHGIDMGDDTVIHFSGEPLHMRHAVVCRIAMADFLQGGQARVVRREEGARSPEEVMSTAESLIGAKSYHPLFNNCEHFATFCMTGRKDSRQARRALKAAATAATVALMGVQVVAVKAAKRRISPQKS